MVLDRQWKDVEAYKMPQSAINRINFIAKKQKSVKGLKFGDHQNMIDAAISTGVIDNQTLAKDLINSDLHYDMQIDNTPSEEQYEDENANSDVESDSIEDSNRSD